MRIPHVRFTVRRMMMVVASVALVIAGYLWAVRPPFERLELAPQPTWASVDHDILDIVLTDLIDNPEFDPAVGGRGVPKSEIVVGDVTATGLSRSGYHLDTWVREGKITAELRADLLARNRARTRYLLARYRPSNPGILVRNLDVIDTDLGFSYQFPKARGYVITRLPAYSRDGQKALLFFAFGPTAHGAGGYYVLHKVKGRWEIIERYIYYFS